MPVLTVFLLRKSFAGPLSSRLFPTFSSIKFNVSGFMLRSLIGMKLSFVQDDIYESICIVHVDVQFDGTIC